MLFLEGLLSFLSPCLLPLLPVYIVYFAGEAASVHRRRTILVRSLGFVLGFTLVFVVLGIFAGTLGQALAAHRTTVRLVCGAMIALFGLSFLGAIRLPFRGINSVRRISGFGSAVAFGMVFAVGLTPCVGAFLGAALMTAASEGGALKGALLLTEYSLGLGIPMVLSALAIDRLQSLFGFFKGHGRVVSVLSGILLIGFGLWTAFSAFPSVGDSKVLPGVDETPELAQNIPKGAKEPMEITLSNANFETEVLKSDRTVLVDFWATWCGPCRMLAPELEALAAERPDVKVGKVNVDENPELCARYGIMSIPAIFVFREGKVVRQAVGYRPKAELLELLR